MIYKLKNDGNIADLEKEIVRCKIWGMFSPIEKRVFSGFLGPK